MVEASLADDDFPDVKEMCAERDVLMSAINRARTNVREWQMPAFVWGKRWGDQLGKLVEYQVYLAADIVQQRSKDLETRSSILEYLRYLIYGLRQGQHKKECYARVVDKFLFVEFSFIQRVQPKSLALLTRNDLLSTQSRVLQSWRRSRYGGFQPMLWCKIMKKDNTRTKPWIKHNIKKSKDIPRLVVK